MSKGESTASGVSTDDKAAAIQYKPVTSLAGNNALVHHSHVATIKYHMHYQILMACTGAAVISFTSYPYTVLTRVSYQAVSLTNSLDTSIGQNASCAVGDFKLGLSCQRVVVH